MSVPFATVLIILLATGVVLLVLLIALARHAKVLARSLAEFQAAVQPALEEILREAEEADRRVQRISDRTPSAGVGARIRR